MVTLLVFGWLFALQPVSWALELKVQALPNTQGENPYSRFHRDALSMFLRDHPDFTMTSATGMGGGRALRMPGGAADSVILMQIAGDIAPDVMAVDYQRSAQFIAKGYLLPLDKYVADLDQAELDRRVPPAVRLACQRHGPDGKKHWYLFPVERQIRGVLIYRRDLLARAGLDPDTPPRTWEELETYIRKLRQPSRNPTTDYYGFNVSKGDLSSRDLIPLLHARGGEMMSLQANGAWRPTIDTPEMLDTLYCYVKLTCTRWTDSAGKLHRGYVLRQNNNDVMWGHNVAMGFYTMRRVYTYSSFHSGKVAWAAAPHPQDHEPGVPAITARLLGVYAGVKSPRIARAAWVGLFCRTAARSRPDG